jgi:hypothetical protein
MREPDGDLWLIQLTITGPVFSLTRQANLDALGLDDRVSTGRVVPSIRIDPDPLLHTFGQLADALFDWWAGKPPLLLYRSRTTPGIGRNVALNSDGGPGDPERPQIGRRDKPARAPHPPRRL